MLVCAILNRYCPGGELFYHLQKAKKFSEARARFYTAELLLALEHLHRHNVIHREWVKIRITNVWIFFLHCVHRAVCLWLSYLLNNGPLCVFSFFILFVTLSRLSPLSSSQCVSLLVVCVKLAACIFSQQSSTSPVLLTYFVTYKLIHIDLLVDQLFLCWCSSVKPENVLLDAEGHVRLTDFGLSKSGVVDNNSATVIWAAFVPAAAAVGTPVVSILQFLPC